MPSGTQHVKMENTCILFARSIIHMGIKGA
jgi:hypothetical protein